MVRYEELTLREAAQECVKGFNAIPTSMIAKLWQADPEDWEEVTNSDNEVEYYDQLPIWGPMWTFGESLDERERRNKADV